MISYVIPSGFNKCYFQIYRVCGATVLCYPLIFEVSDFYLYRDMALLIDDIKTELQFVGRYWRLSGRPTVCLLIREEHMRDPQFKKMVDLLAMLKKGYCDTVKVRIGRLQNLISSSCVGMLKKWRILIVCILLLFLEHLDFMNTLDLTTDTFAHFKQLEHDYIGYQSLTDVPRMVNCDEELQNYMVSWHIQSIVCINYINNFDSITNKNQQTIS